MAIDYRLLLQKYICHVGVEEGSTFIREPRKEPRHVEGNVYLSVEEQQELWKLQQEEIPSSRPEYVHCIRKGETKEGICGRSLGFEFAFVDLKHAQATETSGSRLVLCEECRKVEVRKS